MPVVKLFRSLLLVALLLSPHLVPLSSGAESSDLASLRAKAGKGNRIAQYNLGLAYAKGGDVPIDLAQAFVWLSLASEGGPTSTELDLLRKRMTEEQLAEGRRLLAQRRSALAGNPDRANPPIPIIVVDKNPASPTPVPLISTSPAATPGPKPVANAEAGSTPDEVATLRTDRKQLSDELASAWKDLEKSRAEVQSSTAERTALKNRLTEAETKLAAAQTRITELGQQPAPDSTLPSQIAGLKDQLQHALRASEELTAKNQTLSSLAEERGHVAQASTTALGSARDGLEKAQADLATQKMKDDENLSRVVAENQTLRQAAAEISTRANAAAEALARAGNQADESARLKRQLEETSQRLETSAGQLAPLQAENEKLKSAATSSVGENAALRTQLASLQEQLAANRELTAKANATPPADPEAAAKLDVALRSYRLAQDERETAKAEATRLASEKSGLEAELAEAKRAAPIAAQAVALREQLRLTQAQATALADENFRLKTERSMTLSSPSRPNLSPPAAPVTTTPASIPKSATNDSAAAPLKPEPRIHVIAAGDTLTRISSLYYGTPNRWSDLLAANRDVVHDEHNLVIGRTLRIP